MGLIMLILIGTMPTAYALNRSMHEDQVQAFIMVSDQAAGALAHHGEGAAPANYRLTVTDYVRTHTVAPETVPAIGALTKDIRDQVANYKSLANIPADQVGNVRNDMYLSSEALRLMKKGGNPAFSADEGKSVDAYRSQLDKATRFIRPGSRWRWPWRWAWAP